MINQQPSLLWKYLGLKKYKLSKDHKSKFYLSWEDALWDILRSFNISQKSQILVPDFFCMDVIKNMVSHGIKPFFYSLNKNLQPNAKELLQLIRNKKPTILVLFHPVGITNHLVNKAFIQSLPSELIVIEDAVHRIIDSSTLYIYSQRHFCITSLRKIVPLQGSFVYGREEAIKQLRGADYQKTIFYSFKVMFFWVLMQLCLLLQRTTPKFTYFGNKAEQFMQKGYDLIGDSQLPGFCPSIFALIYQFIDVSKIEQIKSDQAKQYLFLIKKHKQFSIPEIKDTDFGKLRGFPVIFPRKSGESWLSAMRQKGILLRDELPGCPWTKNRLIVYLPMGPHIHPKEIKQICQLFGESLN